MSRLLSTLAIAFSLALISKAVNNMAYFSPIVSDVLDSSKG
jgi:hypothetical protein